MLDLDKREHNSFARIHNLSNEPALFYLNSGGQIVKRGTTPPNTEELIVMAEEALELKVRIEEKYNLEAMKDKYKHHFDSPDFLYDFAYMLKAYGEPHNTVVNQYLSTQTENSLGEEKNRAFVYDFANSLENEAIDFFLTDIGHYKELIGGREINDKIKISTLNPINKPLFKTLSVCISKVCSLIFIISSEGCGTEYPQNSVLGLFRI